MYNLQARRDVQIMMNALYTFANEHKSLVLPLSWAARVQDEHLILPPWLI